MIYETAVTTGMIVVENCPYEEILGQNFLNKFDGFSTALRNASIIFNMENDGIRCNIITESQAVCYKMTRRIPYIKLQKNSVPYYRNSIGKRKVRNILRGAK